MFRQPDLLDWSVLADDDWAQLDLPEGQVETREAVRSSEWRILVGVVRALALATAIVALTGATFTPPHEQSPWAYETIMPTVRRESQAWVTRDEQLLSSVIDPLVSARFQDEWRVGWASDENPTPQYSSALLVAEPVGDLIRVQVRIQQELPQWWLSSPYRETRFYRPTTAGWLRTVPATEFWGQARAVETAHLRFEFYDYDFQNVMDIVDRVELAYVRAHGWLGLVPPKGDEKITVALLPELVRGWGNSGYRLQVTSPALAKVPDGLSDADYLVQQIIGRLSSRLLGQLLADHERNNAYQWRTLLWALSGWWRTELIGQRSSWHVQAQTLFRGRLLAAYPLRLNQIENGSPSWRAEQGSMMVEYMTAESVIEYALNRYGRTRLADLVMALNDYGSWVGLVPHLYDESAAEFETGWNQYLAERYGVDGLRP